MGRTVETALFYYTLIVLLVAILTAATCLSSYLVSRKRRALFAFFGFLFYFFDVALVFQGDFITQNLAFRADSFYSIGNPFASIVIGAGVFASFWLFLCDFLDETRRGMLIVPPVVFVVGSLAVLLAIPEGNWHEFLFYSMRAAMLAWMLIYCAFRYVRTKDEVTRTRLWRRGGIYVLLWVLGIGVVLENVFFLLVLDLSTMQSDTLPFLPERNFAENFLFLFCAFFACRDAWSTLALRFEAPPTQDSKPMHVHIDQNLVVYSNRHGLSKRESEVLHLILLGKDNQNIASSMQLALSTVKVHVHKILQKTSQPNRQALVRDFWKTA